MRKKANSRDFRKLGHFTGIEQDVSDCANLVHEKVFSLTWDKNTTAWNQEVMFSPSRLMVCIFKFSNCLTGLAVTTENLVFCIKLQWLETCIMLHHVWHEAGFSGHSIYSEQVLSHGAFRCALTLEDQPQDIWIWLVIFIWKNQKSFSQSFSFQCDKHLWDMKFKLFYLWWNLPEIPHK